MEKTKLKFHGSYPVWYFDSEHSMPDLYLIGMRILKMTGMAILPRLLMYTLRGATPPEMRLFVRKKMETAAGPTLVVLDNFRDWFYNINDQMEALATIKLIQNICDMGHHVILVLHVSRAGDGLANGAAGSYAMAGAEITLGVTKNGQISIVKPVFSRGKEPDEFAIRINEEGIPEFAEDWVKAPERTKGRGKRSTSPADISEEDHRKVLEKFMLNADGRGVWVTRKEMVANLKTGFLNLGISIGDNKLRDYLKYYEEQKIIGKNQKSVGKTKVDNYQLLRKKACSSVC